MPGPALWLTLFGRLVTVALLNALVGIPCSTGDALVGEPEGVAIVDVLVGVVTAFIDALVGKYEGVAIIDALVGKPCSTTGEA